MTTQPPFRLCAVVPTYDNPTTIARVVTSIREVVPDVIVIDDGSAAAGRAAVERLREVPGVRTHRRARNGGKGAAVKDGLVAAGHEGFTHALQIDADGQHDLADILRFVEAARAAPQALILGSPQFDRSAPRARVVGRAITRFWTNLETHWSGVIDDPMCGFRIYPVEASLRTRTRGNAMDFDPEIAVRLVWLGTPVINLPTRVRYLRPDEGGVSSFRMIRDNALISWMHTRLTVGAALRVVGLGVNRRGWLDVAEVGGAWGIRLFVVVGTMFGRRAARALLPLVALYYVIVHATARRASTTWFRRVRGTDRVGWRDVYTHVLRFAQVTVDRMFLVRRQLWRYEIHYHGDEAMQKIRDGSKGVMMLGAHIGSFEVMRACADSHDLPINILGYFANARMINAALGRLDPGWNGRVIDVRPDSADFVLDVKERIDAGEHVAVLGDRVGLAGKTVEVDFFGRPARFPIGAYLLASILRCPVYLFIAVHTPSRRYDIHCEAFAERIELNRATRTDDARRYAQRYAQRLEHFGRRHPDNWFNFYDFWSGADEA